MTFLILKPSFAPSDACCLLSFQASDAYYSSLETGQHLDGLLGLGTTAGQTHSQPDALVALRQHLDLSPNTAQVTQLSSNVRVAGW